MDTASFRPPPSLAKRLALLVGVLVLGGLGAAMAGRLGEAMEDQAALEAERVASAEAAGAARQVAVVSPQATETAPLVVLTGTLEPVQSAGLAFEVGGQVNRLEVALGDEVEEGDLLVALDRSSVGAASAQSRAAIDVANANAEMARDRVRLLEPLVAAGSMAERELITARQQLSITEAQLMQARAGRRQIAATSANHVLRAPFDGIVTQVPSGVGVPSTPGMPLVRVEDLSALRLRTTVNRRELEALQVGARVQIEGAPVDGVLETVVRSLDADTRRAPVEVRVPNDSGQLVANAFVRASIAIGEPRPVLSIPATARRPDGSVLVVEDGSRLVARPVMATPGADGAWMVTDGLSPEDRVVLRPALVREGAVVVPVEPPATQATAGLTP
ncbi:MAG: efflux RND transporter periplasmic adaptor subunit [Sandaracinaceae bacterium]